ncbi:MAG: medium chain dehydrogenase/reductase family protein [Anaerolineales bacterium]|nr:medium chain dehydrogenase/reductase family protein [Anaerolineales bacterium]
MKYKSVIVPRRGSPEVFKVIENELRAPSHEEARIKILAAPVCLPDVQARYGYTPFPPRTPFVPGYAIIGTVDAVGKKVNDIVVGDRVAALTAYGGYSEYIFLKQKQLIRVPTNIDPAGAATLILNYVLAYQTLHRSAKVKTGDKILIVGASGGIGTAYLQLGKLANLTMYGIASKSKHHILAEYGATPIDYRTQNLIDVIRQLEPNGINAVFDGMGGDYIEQGVSVLQHGGIFVEYGNPLTFSRMLRLLRQVILLNLQPNGISVKLYGNSSRLNMQPFREDWAILFKLLEEGKIKPVIHKKFPILEASQANVLLESGQVIGNVVLLTPELL